MGKGGGRCSGRKVWRRDGGRGGFEGKEGRGEGGAGGSEEEGEKEGTGGGNPPVSMQQHKWSVLHATLNPKP